MSYKRGRAGNEITASEELCSCVCLLVEAECVELMGARKRASNWTALAEVYRLLFCLFFLSPCRRVKRAEV